jgi:hypothetical protein
VHGLFLAVLRGSAVHKSHKRGRESRTGTPASVCIWMQLPQKNEDVGMTNCAVGGGEGGRCAGASLTGRACYHPA